MQTLFSAGFAVTQGNGTLTGNIISNADLTFTQLFFPDTYFICIYRIICFNSPWNLYFPLKSYEADSRA